MWIFERMGLLLSVASSSAPNCGRGTREPNLFRQPGFAKAIEQVFSVARKLEGFFGNNPLARELWREPQNFRHATLSAFEPAGESMEAAMYACAQAGAPAERLKAAIASS